MGGAARLISGIMQPMTDQFLRQRRNLFVVSAILLALCLGGVDLQELSFAGMKFSAFRKPEVFLGGVWVAFGYFAYRYLVYSLECSPEELKKTFTRELERAVNPRIEYIVRRKYSKPNEACRFSYAFLRRDDRTYKGQALLPTDSDPSKHEIKDIKLPISIWSTLPWELWGIFRFTVFTPVVSEHLLPFVIAAGTFFYCGFFATWEGSFRTLAA
jgi:hypothetical protein